MLLRGGSVDEILEDYLYLTQQDLGLARAFALDENFPPV